MNKNTKSAACVSRGIVTAVLMSVLFAGMTWAPAGERRIPSGIVAGPLFFPDGTSTDPTMAFASETGTGWHLSKALRMAASIDGIGVVFSIDAVGVTIDGDLIVGDVIGDTLTVNAGTVTYASDLAVGFALDALYAAPGGIVRFTTSAVEVVGAIEVTGNTQLGDAVGDSLTVRAGTITHPNATTVNIDNTYVFDAMGQSPQFKGTTYDYATFVTNLTVPDANAATEALNQQTGDARYIMATTQDSIEVLFGGNTFSNFSTSNTSYTTAGIFRFGGTTARGTPTSIKFIGFKDASPTSWDVQVFDLTNSLVIAEVTGSTGTAAELVTDGTLTNLPTGEAMWEVQLKRTGGTGGSEAHVHATSVLF